MSRLARGWANIIKVRAVAAAAVGNLEEARRIQTYVGDLKSSEATEWEPPQDKTIEDILEKTFEQKLPFAITRYETPYAKPLDYRWSRSYGIGGWPNCILIYEGNLVLVQFRANVDRRAMMHATGLHVVLESNVAGINKKFKENYRLKPSQLSQEIFFLNETGFLTRSQVYSDIREEFLAVTERFRQNIRIL